MEVKRTVYNSMGIILGFQECMLCGDRENWKSFIIINFDEKVSDKVKDYNVPICDECFISHPLDDIIYSVKKDLVEVNNFTRKLRYAPFYTDIEIDNILASIKSTKTTKEAIQ